MNEKTLTLIRSIVSTLIIAIGVFLILKAMGTDAEVVDSKTGETIGDTAMVSASVNYSLALLYIVLGIIAVFVVMGAVINPKRFINSLIGVGVFGVIALIAYLTATVETAGDILELEGATESNLKMGGAGIQATFILVGLAIILILVQTVRNIMGYFAK